MKFKLTRNQNDWKFEFKLFKNGILFIRGKIYIKSLELLTSKGVSLKSTADPLFRFLLTTGKRT